ncbi:TIGR02281 family clan AA aspartic protease [Caenimonas koreensis]|uniref:TIGR02281 family clan AA aspartic protease n=1 Tax=Caenimonas koreensis DSM 17982 TaxID=1121255 RepID=A0A844AZA8_9BURK|nr:retropepsin-like aspartic protease [Caenimonas koreensis]MRD46392.1 TIGR02281 family clan AA aspartic protease [Caenimonas koreensis DSM 17982]
MKALLTAVVLAAACTCAIAQEVALTGMLGGKALLIINGAAPRVVAPGESRDGVKVVSTSGEQAVLEINGKKHTLRVGDAPASVGSGNGAAAGGSGTRVVLPVGSGGHYFSAGSINGRSVNFMVDTGATFIAMSASDAQRLGIDYLKSTQRGQISTANGPMTVSLVKLNSVRLGDVEVFNVDAVVGPQAMPFILLGNSFLSRFQMTQGSGQMVLERRY